MLCNLQERKMRSPGLVTYLIAPWLVATSSTGAASQIDTVALGKRASVLVEIPRTEDSGSAFSIGHGYLVTSAHVVEGAQAGSGIRVVVQPGERGQKVTPARIMRVDKDRDLALLRIDPGSAPPPLALGDGSQLQETAPVVVFGFPFGSFLSERQGEFPNVTVTTGNITALRKSNGALAHIQLNASVNPGNSGGPVLNQRGEVIGVVEAMITGTDLNFATPVNRLREFLARPEIVVTAPSIDTSGKGAVLAFTIEVTTFLPADTEPVVSIAVSSNGGPTKVVNASAAGVGRYAASVPTPSAANGPLELILSDGSSTTTLNVKDQALRISSQNVQLSEIRSIEKGSGVKTTLTSGRIVTGAVVGLTGIVADVNGISAKMDLSGYRSITVTRGAGATGSFDYTVMVKQGGRTTEVSGATSVVPTQGTTLDAPSTPASVSVSGSNYVRNAANGHWYCTVRMGKPIRWGDARKAASAMRYMGMKGHLATVTSADEAEFISVQFPGDGEVSWWIGAFQDTSSSDYREPAGGWRWVTGEPWNFTNWRRGEPNDPGGHADFIDLFPDGSWNDTIETDDHGTGFIVEFE
jgi:hypothetical protein